MIAVLKAKLGIVVVHDPSPFSSSLSQPEGAGCVSWAFKLLRCPINLTHRWASQRLLAKSVDRPALRVIEAEAEDVRQAAAA
jgi:hypothetical protein